MKHTLMLVAGLASLCLASASAEEAAPPAAYDAALAKALGADEYGMRAYIFVLLKTGPTTIDDEARRKELFAGHFANMNRLAERGELIVAGPLSDDTGKRGLFVLNAPSIEAAEEMVAADPAVSSGMLAAEYSKFYGSAALMQVNAIHKKVQSKEF